MKSDQDLIDEAKQKRDAISKELALVERQVHVINAGGTLRLVKPGTSLEMSNEEVEEHVKGSAVRLRGELQKANEAVQHYEGVARLPEPLKSEMLRRRQEVERNARRAAGLPPEEDQAAAAALPDHERIRREAIARQQENLARRQRGEKIETFKEEDKK